MAAGRKAPSLRWDDLQFTINTREGFLGAKRGEKMLLKGVSGDVQPRSLTAIMGPSGSGKTTLLDVLSGTHYGGRVSGSVEVNGVSIDTWRTAQDGRASYVMQLDVLPYLDTPREALTTAALLRLPTFMSREDKMERVEELLEVLDLQKCADLMIGDAKIGIRGLSGGQCRRVTIGIELIKNPSLILLDEPLSGLDSEMGEAVVQSLSRLTSQGRTIMLSVHSASATMMQAFTSTILMAEGRVVFQGPCKSAAAHLESLGHMPVEGQSIAEFLLYALKDPASAAAAADAWEAAAGEREGKRLGLDPASSLEMALAMEAGQVPKLPPTTTLLTRSRTLLVDRAITMQDGTKVVLEKQANIFVQVWVLVSRFLRWKRRNIAQSMSQLGLGLFSGLLMGMIFFALPSEVASGTMKRSTALWLAMSIPSVYTTSDGIVEWYTMRPLLRRELTTGLYSATAVWLTFSSVVLVWLCLCMFPYSVQYPMEGLQFDFVKYIIWVAAASLVTFGSYFLGFSNALIWGNATTALAVTNAINLVLLCTSGFLNPDPPVYLQWLQQANFQSWAYSAMAKNEFIGLTLTGANGEVTLEEVPPYASAIHSDWPLSALLAMLGAITGCIVLVSYPVLLLMARLKRI